MVKSQSPQQPCYRWRFYLYRNEELGSNGNVWESDNNQHSDTSICQPIPLS